MNIILASKSPRRSEILKNLGVEFTVFTAETDESSNINSPELLVEELSKRKALAVKDILIKENKFNGDTVIIAADTVVAKDGNILGKPTSRTDAKCMLKLLSGESHSVTSGVAVIKGEEILVNHETTLVYFDPLSDDEIENYIATGECDDKAGSYGIQGYASKFINRIDGCYFNVVGLPVNLLYKMLKKLSIDIFK
ncbi:MAG: septum formation protein Maf [Ruminococcaceae bacterium]|nr:septum formation protein Maf [Oscillospiraceae bacterium]